VVFLLDGVNIAAFFKKSDMTKKTIKNIQVKTATLKLQSSWENVKEKLKENDITLTDEDLKYTPGHEDELLERLQKKLRKDKQAIKDYIESVSANKGKAS
jgi:uncharacterized protein YjbJ (UPF0337 family)